MVKTLAIIDLCIMVYMAISLRALKVMHKDFGRLNTLDCIIAFCPIINVMICIILSAT